MRTWLIAAILAPALSGMMVAGAHLSEARSRKTSEILAMVPGAREISVRQMTADPPLFSSGSPRIWVFSLKKEQARAIKARCDRNRRIFPNADVEMIHGCVASYYFDPLKYRYITLALKGDPATISSMGMSR